MSHSITQGNLGEKLDETTPLACITQHRNAEEIINFVTIRPQINPKRNIKSQ